MDDLVVWMDGELVPKSEAKVSVWDHGLLYGDGVFEGIRFYNRRFLKMRTHLERLFDSAVSISLNIPYTLEELDAATRLTADRNGETDGYVRMVVTRGVGPLGVNPLQCTRPTTFIIVDQVEVYPEAAYQNGLSVIIASTQQKHAACLSPAVKSLNYLNNMLAKLQAIHAKAEEAVMLNQQGFVAECVGDNIFIVKNSVIKTPPLHAGILEGVTRNLVIEMARGQGFEVREDDMTPHELYTADEIFLTGTGAEVAPVVNVEGRPVGDGKVGPVTNQLLSAFRELLKNAPED